MSVPPPVAHPDFRFDYGDQDAAANIIVFRQKEKRLLSLGRSWNPARTNDMEQIGPTVPAGNRALQRVRSIECPHQTTATPINKLAIPRVRDQRGETLIGI